MVWVEILCTINSFILSFNQALFNQLGTLTYCRPYLQDSDLASLLGGKKKGSNSGTKAAASASPVLRLPHCAIAAGESVKLSLTPVTSIVGVCRQRTIEINGSGVIRGDGGALDKATGVVLEAKSSPLDLLDPAADLKIQRYGTLS